MDAIPENQNKNLRRLGSFYVSLITLSILSIILQIIGYTTPGWYRSSSVDSDDVTKYSLNRGLWFMVYCEPSDDCETISLFDEDKEELRKEMKPYQIMSSVALPFTIASLVFIILARSRGTKSSKWFKIIALLTALCSTVISLVCSGWFGNVNYEIDWQTRLYSSSSRIDFPYSLLLFGLGGVFMFVIAVIILCNLCIKWIAKEVRTQLTSPARTDNISESQVVAQHQTSNTGPQVIYTGSSNANVAYVQTHPVEQPTFVALTKSTNATQDNVELKTTVPQAHYPHKKPVWSSNHYIST